MTNPQTERLREEIATKIYHTLTTRVTFILPEGITLLGFSEQLADQILQACKEVYGEVLDIARSAILDAICCEDGLDAGTGKEVIDMITELLGDYEEWHESVKNLFD